MQDGQRTQGYYRCGRCFINGCGGGVSSVRVLSLKMPMMSYYAGSEAAKSGDDIIV